MELCLGADEPRILRRRRRCFPPSMVPPRLSARLLDLPETDAAAVWFGGLEGVEKTIGQEFGGMPGPLSAISSSNVFWLASKR